MAEQRRVQMFVPIRLVEIRDVPPVLVVALVRVPLHKSFAFQIVDHEASTDRKLKEIEEMRGNS